MICLSVSLSVCPSRLVEQTKQEEIEKEVVEEVASARLTGVPNDLSVSLSVSLSVCLCRLVEQKKKEEIEKKEIEEKVASIKCLEALLELLKKPLDILGDDDPPSAFEAMDGGGDVV